MAITGGGSPVHRPRRDISSDGGFGMAATGGAGAGPLRGRSGGRPPVHGGRLRLELPDQRPPHAAFGFKGFVAPPAVGDSGMALGIGLHRAHRSTATLDFRLGTAFHGRRDADVDGLRRHPDCAHFIKQSAPQQVVADILDGPVVWFDGAADRSARAGPPRPARQPAPGALRPDAGRPCPRAPPPLRRFRAPPRPVGSHHAVGRRRRRRVERGLRPHTARGPINSNKFLIGSTSVSHLTPTQCRYMDHSGNAAGDHFFLGQPLRPMVG